MWNCDWYIDPPSVSPRCAKEAATVLVNQTVLAWQLKVMLRLLLFLARYLWYLLSWHDERPHPFSSISSRCASHRSKSIESLYIILSDAASVAGSPTSTNAQPQQCVGWGMKNIL